MNFRRNANITTFRAKRKPPAPESRKRVAPQAYCGAGVDSGVRALYSPKRVFQDTLPDKSRAGCGPFCSRLYGGLSHLFRLYFTRLILPIVFVAGMVAIPFVWLPEITPPEKTPAAQKASGEVDKKTRRATPFQKTMTIGFALILVSVTAGGYMLYRITRSQTASWRRRFAPAKRRGR